MRNAGGTPTRRCRSEAPRSTISLKSCSMVIGVRRPSPDSLGTQILTTVPETSDSISFMSFIASMMQMERPFSTRPPSST
jgi:hypothetical protein